MNGIKKWFKAVRIELFYAGKAFWSVVSGYEELQYRDSEGVWQNVGNNFPEDPHWICPLFYSGRHLPLPFFTDPKAEIGWFQKKAIQFAAKLNPGSYRAAQEVCAWYEHDCETFVEFGKMEKEALHQERESEEEALAQPLEDDGRDEPREIPNADSPGGFTFCQ